MWKRFAGPTGTSTLVAHLNLGVGFRSTLFQPCPGIVGVRSRIGSRDHFESFPALVSPMLSCLESECLETVRSVVCQIRGDDARPLQSHTEASAKAEIIHGVPSRGVGWLALERNPRTWLTTVPDPTCALRVSFVTFCTHPMMMSFVRGIMSLCGRAVPLKTRQVSE